MCGIPSITLLGTKDDWSAITDRITPITQGKFGRDAVPWGQMLTAVLQRFERAFDGDKQHDGGEDRRFWNDVVKFRRDPGVIKVGEDSPEPNAGGVIGGWITAFTTWAPPQDTSQSTPAHPISMAGSSPLNLPSASQVDTFQVPHLDPNTTKSISSSGKPIYALDNVSFPTLHPDRIPSAISVLPFRLNDNGRVVDTRLLVGHVGKTWFGMKGDTVQPSPIWFLYVPSLDTLSGGAPEMKRRTTLKRVVAGALPGGKSSSDGGHTRGKSSDGGHRRSTEGYAYGYSSSGGGPGGTFAYGAPTGSGGADKPLPPPPEGSAPPKNLWKKMGKHIRTMSGVLERVAEKDKEKEKP